MPTIRRIDVFIRTGNISNAGTNGSVFIAIAGREFHLDSSENDFERGKEFTYTLGDGSTVSNATNNDPRKPFPLDIADVDRFPVWLRFEPSGGSPDWNLELVSVTATGDPIQVQYQALERGNLWLGQNSGKYCFLKRV
jgi:hypothetical protein